MAIDWSTAAQALLDADERLLAAEAIEPAAGIGPPPPPPPPGGTQLTRSGSVLNTFLHVISPNASLPGQGRLEALLFGVAAAGEPTSRGGDLYRAHLHTGGARTTVLAVTDRRFLVCVTPERKLLSLADESKAGLEAIWSVPRAEVSAASVQRYRLRRRLRIDFTDGSWAAFATPLAETSEPARKLAAAFG